MRNEAPVIVFAEWAARVNAETRRVMGVSVAPEIPERQEARAYLAGLMTDEQAAACVAADLERVRSLGGRRPRHEYEGLSWSFAAACRVADAEFLVKQRDPARLRDWLSRHSAAECNAILKHLEKGGRG